jgi:hypothetical protein
MRGESKIEGVEVASRAHQVVKGVAVVLAHIGEKDCRPEVLGFCTRTENKVHIINNGHLNLIVHVLREET